jgi:Mg2+ and Co2+ transporter CorA
MEEQLLGCREKLKEIRSLVFDKMKMIKEMQLKCQALRLASHGYELEKPTTEGVEQCKIEDKKTMGGAQNQTNSASHNLSKQQYSNWVEEIFARLKSFPPP